MSTSTLRILQARPFESTAHSSYALSPRRCTILTTRPTFVTSWSHHVCSLPPCRMGACVLALSLTRLVLPIPSHSIPSHPTDCSLLQHPGGLVLVCPLRVLPARHDSTRPGGAVAACERVLCAHAAPYHIQQGLLLRGAMTSVRKGLCHPTTRQLTHSLRATFRHSRMPLPTESVFPFTTLCLAPELGSPPRGAYKSTSQCVVTEPVK